MIESRTQPRPATWDFFISHASRDKTHAERLHNALSTSGRTFLASRCLDLGTMDFESSLLDALQESRVIVPLISSNISQAYYQRAEIVAAIELARAYPGRYQIVPVDLDGTMTGLKRTTLVAVGATTNVRSRPPHGGRRKPSAARP